MAKFIQYLALRYHILHGQDVPHKKLVSLPHFSQHQVAKKDIVVDLVDLYLRLLPSFIVLTLTLVYQMLDVEELPLLRSSFELLEGLSVSSELKAGGPDVVVDLESVEHPMRYVHILF